MRLAPWHDCPSLFHLWSIIYFFIRTTILQCSFFSHTRSISIFWWKKCDLSRYYEIFRSQMFLFTVPVWYLCYFDKIHIEELFCFDTWFSVFPSKIYLFCFYPTQIICKLGKSFSQNFRSFMISFLSFRKKTGDVLTRFDKTFLLRTYSMTFSVFAFLFKMNVLSSYISKTILIHFVCHFMSSRSRFSFSRNQQSSYAGFCFDANHYGTLISASPAWGSKSRFQEMLSTWFRHLGQLPSEVPRPGLGGN